MVTDMIDLFYMYSINDASRNKLRKYRFPSYHHYSLSYSFVASFPLCPVTVAYCTDLSSIHGRHCRLLRLLILKGRLSLTRERIVSRFRHKRAGEKNNGDR